MPSDGLFPFGEDNSWAPAFAGVTVKGFVGTAKGFASWFIATRRGDGIIATADSEPVWRGPGVRRGDEETRAKIKMGPRFRGDDVEGWRG